jgi:membrane protein
MKELSKKLYDITSDFFDDDTLYYAASLSFFTIFALLPILALLIVIGSYLDFFNQYIDLLMKYLLETLNPTHSEKFITSIKDFLSNLSSLGNIGLIYVIIVVSIFVNDYEYIVNKIHQTQKRPIFRAIFIYTILIIFLSIIFGVFKLVLSLYSSDTFETITTFILGWSIFAIFFKISINKKLHIKPVLYSTFVTIVTLNITKNIFIYYVIYNKAYTTIYGSFSTLMFFFLWLYISWIIYLYGIKLCHNLNMKYSK